MPRKITGAAFLSLDGVMQGPGGPTEDTSGGFTEGGWVFKLADDAIDETLGLLFSQPYDLLLGRKTYDIFAAYWPHAQGEDGGIGEVFNRTNKYVLTRGSQVLEWHNSHRMAGIADVAALKQQSGADIIIQGSSTIYPALLAAGLIDTLIMMTYPVLLGCGKRLFGEGTPVDRLEMIDHRVSAKGTVIATYRPGGTMPPYPSDAPSALEREP